MPGKGTIERAFELARSGSCHSTDDIRRVLTREGHEGVASHLSGRTVVKQLRALISAATPKG